MISLELSTPRPVTRPLRIETRVGLTGITDFKKIGRDCLIGLQTIIIILILISGSSWSGPRFVPSQFYEWE